MKPIVGTDEQMLGEKMLSENMMSVEKGKA